VGPSRKVCGSTLNYQPSVYFSNVDSTSGCVWRLQVIAAVVAVIVGGAFIRQSFWYHQNLDGLIRIPFVFGSFMIGLLIVGFGISLLLPKR
jgi:hypothetical protein